MVATRESPYLFLSLTDLAEAVYLDRVSSDDLKRAKYCFVKDQRCIVDEKKPKGIETVTDRLRYTCIIYEPRVKKTLELLRHELTHAEEKGRLIWCDPNCPDSWSRLNQMLVREGFQAVNTSRPYNYRGVIDEVKRLQLPLRAVVVPEY